MHSSADRRRPQLSVEELLHFRWLLGGLLALLSIWTLFYLERSIWPMALAGTAAICVGLAYPGLPARVPRWLWRLGVPGIVVLFALDLLLHEPIPAFVRLNALLVVLRAVSYRTRREDLQLVVLCLFLVVVTGVLTVSLVFAVQILLFTGVAMVFLFVVNLIDDATAGRPMAAEQWALISRKRFLHRLWQVFDLRLLSLGAVLFIAVVGISTVIFLAIPRFQIDNAMNFLELGRSRTFTGFSETIALGEVTDIAQDDRIAMRIDVQGGEAVAPELYWRMVVLDEYGQGTFRVSRAVQARVGVRSLPMLDFTPEWAAVAHDNPPPAPGEPRYIVFMEPGLSRFLPLPGRFRGLRFREVEDVIENRFFNVYATERQSATLASFQIEGADFSGVIPDPAFATVNLRAPAVDPRSEAWADENFRWRFLNYPATTRIVPVGEAARNTLREIVGEITHGERIDAREFSRRACSYLAAHHRYSLGASLPPASEGREDPVVRWLQGDVSGHCEFFAASFTLLSRTAGFATRAVTGFKGGTWNAYENYYMVRNSDAHAWCEVFDDGARAWFRVDPTPGSSGVAGATPQRMLGTLVADHSFNAYFDSLRMLWYRRIVNFDQRAQRQVAGTLREVRDDSSLWLGAVFVTFWQEFRGWTERPWSFRAKGDLLFVAVAAFLLASLMQRLGLGTSDVLAWLRTGERPTRRRAGELLQRLRRRRAEPPARRWDEAAAQALEEDLRLIRFGRADHWPEPLPVFRAVRRML